MPATSNGSNGRLLERVVLLLLIALFGGDTAISTLDRGDIRDKSQDSCQAVKDLRADIVQILEASFTVQEETEPLGTRRGQRQRDTFFNQSVRRLERPSC